MPSGLEMSVRITLRIVATLALVAVLCPRSTHGNDGDAGCRDLNAVVLYDALLPLGKQLARVLRIDSVDSAAVVTAAFHGIPYTTSDGGLHWTKSTLPDALIARSDSSVLYKYRSNGVISLSRDAGKSWVVLDPVVDGIKGQEVAARASGDPSYVVEFEIAAIHPLKALTVYGTLRIVPPRRPEGNPAKQYFLKGMYVSYDGGGNWTKFSDVVGIFRNYPRRVVIGISPVDSAIMFSEGERGVLRSADGGQTWRDVGQSDELNQVPIDTDDLAAGIKVPQKRSPLNAREFVFDPSNSSVVYMIADKGVYRTMDGGDTWKLLNVGFDQLKAINSLAIDPLHPNRVFVGTVRGLFVSEDSGCKFSRLPTP